MCVLPASMSVYHIVSEDAKEDSVSLQMVESHHVGAGVGLRQSDLEVSALAC